MKLDPIQEAAVISPESRIFVAAGPGSEIR